jgi:hypothetical protein
MVEKDNQSADLEEVSFPLDHKLLEEANKIKKERSVIRARLEKIKESKTSVSGTVFDKVKNDYISVWKKRRRSLAEKERLDRELATLYETRTKVAEKSKAQEKLEEIHSGMNLANTRRNIQPRRNRREQQISKFERYLPPSTPTSSAMNPSSRRRRSRTGTHGA